MVVQMVPLRLFTLGAPEVLLGEKPLAFPTRKTLALLIYLAIEAPPQPREHLAALLWPESSPERSFASLRNTLGHLQNAIRQANGQSPTSYLSITHHTLGLNPDANIDLDLLSVEQAYLQARTDRASRALPEGSAFLPLLQLAVARHRGDFLIGFSLSDSAGFDDWVSLQREVWNRRLGLIMDRLSEVQFANGEFAYAAETASHWITLDTLNEKAYRRKMRAHFAAGERGQALATYETCRALLAVELKVEPEPDTEALALQIRSQHPLKRAVPQPHPPITPVAYLENLYIGRRAEHQILVDTYNLAAAGQLQVLVLHGEAGMGKTRLSSEFLAWTNSQGAVLLKGEGFESGSHLPFQPLIDALRFLQVRETPPGDLLEMTGVTRLTHLLSGSTIRGADSAAAALENEDPENHIQPGGNGNRTQISESFVQLTFTLAKHTSLVIFVDDFQWTDTATQDLLLYSIRQWRNQRAPIMLFVSLRSEALHPMTQPRQSNGSHALIQWLSQVRREVIPILLELKPLEELETVQMIMSILTTPGTDFAQWVYHETRGHPFYLMESLKDMLERGALHPKRRANGQWGFSIDAEHNLGEAVRVSSTVRDVILSRLNRLSPNAFTLLAIGAVLEQQITFEHLCAISNLSEDAALPALDELISSRLLIEAAQTSSSNPYFFANDMIRDVVYTEAGDARRRLFHRRSLEVLEAAKSSSAVLAHHALAAGQVEAAFRFSLDAGREALELSAVNEAVIHYEQARLLLQDATLQEFVTEDDLDKLYLPLEQAYELIDHPAQILSIKLEMEQFKQGLWKK